MKRSQALLVALAVVMAACSGSSGTSEDTGVETTVAPATKTTPPAPTTTEGGAQNLLHVLGQEVQSWGVSESSWECVEEGLIEGDLLEGVVDLSDIDPDAQLSETPEELERFIAAIFSLLVGPSQGCLSPEEIAAAEEFFASNPQGPLTYGSDATLDMLYHGCLEGAMSDCDMLYLVAGFNSEYEEQAATCGDRNDPIEADTTCMLEYSDVAGFDKLAKQCESGFFVACDALHVVAALGSPEEKLAASCGDIRETDYMIPCWIVYGLGTR
jgi:hypothetical protein